MTRRPWLAVLTVVSLVVPCLAVVGVTVAGADEALPADREVQRFGDAPDLGSLGSIALSQPLVAVAVTPSGQGYWLVARDGGVFAFGDAAFFGSTGGIRLNAPIIAAAATPTGRGYWLIASDGGVFAFGDAAFFGSTGNLRLNQPVSAADATPSGQGYWLVARDGGVFAFGDAAFFGSTGGIRLNAPIMAAAATPTGAGYRLFALDGGVFAFGDATFEGSTSAVPLDEGPITAAAATPSGRGYWLANANGGVFAFGDAPVLGSGAGRGLDAHVVAMAATPTGQGYWLVTQGGCQLVDALAVPAIQQTTRSPGENNLVDVDVEQHRCFQRVTFTFEPAGSLPAGPLGWSVGYQLEPIRNIAGFVVDVAGPAHFFVRVFPARISDIEADPIVDTYTGPREIVPSAGPVREIQFVDDFEALMEWAIGIDAFHAVRVIELTDPPRLLIDVATRDEVTPVPTRAVTVHFTDGVRLVARNRTVRSTTTAGVQEAVQALVEGPTFDEFRERDLRTAVPDTTTLLGVTVSGTVATVDLTGDFAEGTDAAALRTRLAQLVYTATAQPDVGSVRLRLDGAPVAAFGASGIRTDRALTRADFADLAPA
jgi:hypothetical protein